MTVSELIEALEKIKETEGNIDVAVIGEYNEVCSAQVRVVTGYDDDGEFKYPDEDELEDENAPLIVGILNLY